MTITYVTERELALERENVKLTQAVRMQAALIETLQSQPVQPTSADYAMGYAEGFNDGCKQKKT